jgi:Protein of unknown function (DUF1648)
MNRDWYKPLTWLMWLALPTTALNYWRAWDELPTRMAVHFDAYWQPNGWTSRQGSLMLGLGIMTFMLVVFTVAAYVVRAQKPGSAWPILIVFYVSLSVLWWANHWIVQRNLGGAPHAESALIEFSLGMN